MINVNKSATTLSEAIGLSEEQFNAFGEKVMVVVNNFANLILTESKDGEPGKASRLDFLETLATFSHEELLLLSLTALEDNIQKAITFKIEEERKEAEAAAKASEAPQAEAIEDAVIVEEPIAEELPKETPEV